MSLGVVLNFVLALFNLLPFPPLDGSKIFMWSRMAWISLIITAGTIFGLTLLISPWWLVSSASWS
jgi:Zn-dependent protease